MNFSYKLKNILCVGHKQQGEEGRICDVRTRTQGIDHKKHGLYLLNSISWLLSPSCLRTAWDTEGEGFRDKIKRGAVHIKNQGEEPPQKRDRNARERNAMGTPQMYLRYISRMMACVIEF